MFSIIINIPNFWSILAPTVPCFPEKLILKKYIIADTMTECLFSLPISFFSLYQSIGGIELNVCVNENSYFIKGMGHQVRTGPERD